MSYLKGYLDPSNAFRGVANRNKKMVYRERAGRKDAERTAVELVEVLARKNSEVAALHEVIGELTDYIRQNSKTLPDFLKETGGTQPDGSPATGLSDFYWAKYMENCGQKGVSPWTETEDGNLSPS